MIGALILAAWGVLLFAWGGFWRADQRLTQSLDPPDWPGVVAVIPARDEAGSIARVVEAHRSNDYPGPFSVIVADDQSSDGTGAAARGAGAQVLDVPPLPDGWSGKLWALQTGLEHAGNVMPDAEWVLLTDADIVHAPDTLRALVAKAEAEDLALVSLMARLDARGFWGLLLIPAFVFFFQKLYPFAWVNRPGHRAAGAAGGCILIRASTLAEIGGIGALKGALIDDCTLAAMVKRGPPRRAVWLGLARSEVVSLRDNRDLSSIWAMVARTAFTQLRHSWMLLIGSVIGMVFLYLGPWMLITWGLAAGAWWPLVAGAFSLWAMTAAYRPTVASYRLGWGWTLSLPLAAVLYSAMTISSAVDHARGRGGRWKGRTYT